MEVSMMLKKRAAGAIAVAISMVVMTIAADVATEQQMDRETVTAETDLATNGIAGIAVAMSQYEAQAYQYMELDRAQVARTDTVRVAAAEEGEDTEEAVPTEETVQPEADETAVQNSAEESTISGENSEEAEWENRLMADVNEFLYVRADASADAEIVGKLYKGDVADIQETGEEWTHITSGNVDGYVSNGYCVTGTEAFAYAKENVGTAAEVQTDGLRVRSDADENAAVITAVSTGTTLQVDTEAETDGDWVPVIYNGTTGYVSSDYVTLSLATGEGVTIEEEREEQERIAAEEAAKKASQVTEVTTVQNSAATASTDEVTLLAAIIQCEAGNEIYEGQVAVGAVVMNRVRSGSYPSGIYEVIYQSGQFPPAGNGSVARIVANGPKATCMQAAQEAIGGADNTAGAMYFKRASSGHAGVVIGNHVFY